MKLKNYLLITSVFFIACGSNQASSDSSSKSVIANEQKTGVPQYTDATEFCYAYVQTLIDGDCEAHMTFYNDGVYDSETYEVLDPRDYKKAICESVAGALEDPTKTLEDYKNNYKVELTDVMDFVADRRERLPENFPYQRGDLYFRGNRLKDPSKQKFLNPLGLMMVLRKVDGYWIIIGLSGN